MIDPRPVPRSVPATTRMWSRRALPPEAVVSTGSTTRRWSRRARPPGGGLDGLDHPGCGLDGLDHPGCGLDGLDHPGCGLDGLDHPPGGLDGLDHPEALGPGDGANRVRWLVVAPRLRTWTAGSSGSRTSTASPAR